MALAYFRMLIHKLFNKYPYIVPEEAHIIILDRNSYVCMAKNGKDTNNTRTISRRVHLVKIARNEKFIRLTGVREVCNWQILQLRILGRII